MEAVDQLDVEGPDGAKTKFLGLAGQAGAGKDFTREWLCERSSLDVIRVAYADEVRREIAEVLVGGRMCELADAFTKPYNIEVRRLLQWWGTDFRRTEDPDYWVKRGIAHAVEIALRAPVDTLVVFTDVRFENEAEAIREQLGGLVFEVRASDEVRAARTGGTVTPAHASEDIDFEVDGEVYNFEDGADPSMPSDFLTWLGLDG